MCLLGQSLALLSTSVVWAGANLDSVGAACVVFAGTVI